MKKFLQFFTLIILSAYYTSCAKMDALAVSEPEKIPKKVTLINEARAFYEQNVKGSVELPNLVSEGPAPAPMTKGYNQVFRTTTNWDKARYLERETYADIVQIPLEAQEKIYARKLMPVDGRPVREKTRAHSKLIIRKNRETGEVQTFVATFIPDKSYVNNPENKVSAVTYNPRHQNFSGIVLFSLLDGTFKYGNIYKDGEVVDRILGYHDAEAAGYDMTQVKNLSITLNGEIVTTRGGWWCYEDSGGGDDDDVADFTCNVCGTNHGSVCIPPVTVPGNGGGGSDIFIFDNDGSGKSGGSGGGDLGGGGGTNPGGTIQPKDYKGIRVPGGESSILDVLRKIDEDCLGGKIISGLSGVEISIYLSGDLPYGTGGKITVYTLDGAISSFKITLRNGFHDYYVLEELFHAHQKMNNPNMGRLNMETEAKVADYSYAKRNGLLETLQGGGAKWNPIYNYIENRNPTTYEGAATATANMGYNGFNDDGSPKCPDIETDRHTNTFDKLSVDCK